MSLRVVGDRIIVLRPSGYGGLPEIAAGLRLLSEAAAEFPDKGRPYVLLSDLSESRGLTREARKYFSENMRRRRRLLGVIFFGASPLQKLSIKIGKRFNYPDINAHIVDDYTGALRRAHAMLSSHGRGGGADVDRPPHPSTAFTGSGFDSVSKEEWRLDMDGFSVEYEVIDGNILWGRGAGFFKAEHLEPLAALREKVAQEARPDGRFDYLIASLKDLKGIDPRARALYMNNIEKSRKTKPLQMIVLHGADRVVKTAIHLARPFISIKIRVADNLEEALALIRKHKKKTRRRALFRFWKGAGAEPAPADRIRECVDDLLRYIGSIDWEKAGIESGERVDDAHPFAPVFEAISLIKGELDDHFKERERAEMALRESEARFQEVLKHSRDILFKRDVQTGEYEYVSQAVARLLGYTSEEMRAREFNGVKALMHPEDAPEYEAFIDDLVKKTEYHDAGAGQVIEYRLKGKDGRYRWFSDNHTLVKDSDGRPRFIIGANRDITARKKAENTLKEHHERFLTVLDSIDAHVYVADMETFEILLMNKRMKENYGRDMVGEICWRAFHEGDGPCDHCTNHRLLDARGRPTGVYTWEGSNPITGKWYVNHDRAIKWVDGRYVRLEIAADITRMKRLEEERRKREERRRHSRKLAAVGTMAEGIAHNFNNYLMAVMGNLDLILSDLPRGSAFETNIREALEATRKAAELSTLMLTYVGQGKVSMKVMDITETAREIMDSLESPILKKARLTFDFSSEPARFKGDADQVRQVVVNLLTNAVEASEERGGEVTLATGRIFCDRSWFARQVMKEDAPDGEYVYFEVIDAGTGMDAETAEKVLDPFFTTKFAGRGLGMAAVAGIMRSHGGAISLESDPGQGTTARVLFPAVEERVAEAPKPAPSKPGSDNGAILLVDDEEIALTVGKAMLEKMGCRVLTAVNGFEAVEMYRERADEIRCVVLDINMPRMDGGEAFRELRAIDPDVRVLISSGFTEGGVADRFEDDAPAGFIHKPFNLKEFMRKIEEVLS